MSQVKGDDMMSKFEVTVRPNTERVSRKARVYVSVDALLPAEPTEKCTDEECPSAWCREARRNGKPELCEVDHQAHGRWFRQASRLTKELIREALTEAGWAVGQTAKLYFSRTAGCSCGCSPGFILDGYISHPERGVLYNDDVWVKAS